MTSDFRDWKIMLWLFEGVRVSLRVQVHDYRYSVWSGVQQGRKELRLREKEKRRENRMG